MNIAKSGKQCLNWNKIPYLSNVNFPLLEKKYYRNPGVKYGDGYGVKPWCYVNVKNRTLEHCEIEAGEGKQRRIKNPVEHLRCSFLRK